MVCGKVVVGFVVGSPVERDRWSDVIYTHMFSSSFPRNPCFSWQLRKVGTFSHRTRIPFEHRVHISPEEIFIAVEPSRYLARVVTDVQERTRSTECRTRESMDYALSTFIYNPFLVRRRPDERRKLTASSSSLHRRPTSPRDL